VIPDFVTNAVIGFEAFSWVCPPIFSLHLQEPIMAKERDTINNNRNEGFYATTM